MFFDSMVYLRLKTVKRNNKQMYDLFQIVYNNINKIKREDYEQPRHAPILISPFCPPEECLNPQLLIKRTRKGRIRLGGRPDRFWASLSGYAVLLVC